MRRSGWIRRVIARGPADCKTPGGTGTYRPAPDERGIGVTSALRQERSFGRRLLDNRDADGADLWKVARFIAA